MTRMQEHRVLKARMRRARLRGRSAWREHQRKWSLRLRDVVGHYVDETGLPIGDFHPPTKPEWI